MRWYRSSLTFKTNFYLTYRMLHSMVIKNLKIKLCDK